MTLTLRFLYGFIGTVYCGFVITYYSCRAVYLNKVHAMLAHQFCDKNDLINISVEIMKTVIWDWDYCIIYKISFISCFSHFSDVIGKYYYVLG